MHKFIWCRSYYGIELNKQGYKILDIYPCKFGDKCRSAHSSDELIVKDHIEKWRDMDKAHINILKIYENVIDVMEKSKDKIINQKYISMMINIYKMRFDEIMAFWYDLACYHRSIANDLPSRKSWQDPRNKPQPIGGFNFQDDVPLFLLENDDDIWALQRTLRMCNKFISLDKSIKISVKDVCCGDVNCKEGVHDENDLVCIDNMLNGTCSCIGKEEYEEKKQKLIDEINKYNITENVNDGFTVKLSKKQKEEYSSLLRIKYNELNSLKRKVHLTEYNMVPMCKLRESKSAIERPVETLEVKKTNKVSKPKF